MMASQIKVIFYLHFLTDVNGFCQNESQLPTYQLAKISPPWGVTSGHYKKLQNFFYLFSQKSTDRSYVIKSFFGRHQQSLLNKKNSTTISADATAYCFQTF